MTETPLLFKEENEAFEAKKDELLKLCAGKFVIFKGREFGGTFDTPQAAYAAGIEKYGNVEFLVRQVERTPKVASIPALFLGLRHACP